MSEETAEVASRGAQVSNFLVKKDKFSALQLSLKNPPINSKSEELKELNTSIVESVLVVLSESEIPALIQKLDLESCDVLMKYVYKFMGRTSNCGLMLKLHAQLVEKAGLGSIMRVMCDRKQV